MGSSFLPLLRWDSMISNYRFGNVVMSFHSPFSLINGGWSEQFRCNDDEKANDKIEIKVGDLPVFSGLQVVYEGPKRISYMNGKGLISYFRELSGEWQYCVERYEDEATIIVAPEAVRYARDIRNLWNKIDFAGVMLKNGHVILHASYVKWNEKGIAFCGPSGIGKSTQADLWNKAGAEVINGDRVMIEVARSAVMHGIPFAGSSGICQNQSAPSTAIIVLGQSEENKIWRLEKQVAIKKLYAQSGLNRWSISEVERSLTLLDRLCEMVPIYQMDCRPDESAVELLKNVLNGRGCR